MPNFNLVGYHRTLRGIARLFDWLSVAQTTLIVDVSVEEQTERRFHREHGSFTLSYSSLLVRIENKADRDLKINELSFNGSDGSWFPCWRMSLLPLENGWRRSALTLNAKESLSIKADWPSPRHVKKAANVYLRLKYGGRYSNDCRDIALPDFWDRKYD